jgi:hypothetical protein
MFNGLSLFQGALHGEFSMWWPCAEEARFSGSATQEHIKRAFQTMSGFESYYLLLLLQGMAPDEHHERRALPFQTARFPLALAGGELMIVSASAEKGLRLHFAPEMSYARRLEWWTRWADQSERVAVILKRTDSPPDSQMKRSWLQRLEARRAALPPEAPLAWCNQMMEVCSVTESVEPLLKVGTLVY